MGLVTLVSGRAVEQTVWFVEYQEVPSSVDGYGVTLVRTQSLLDDPTLVIEDWEVPRSRLSTTELA